MRYHIASIDRARSLAHVLMSLVSEIAARKIKYTEAQHAIARVAGYNDWAELKRTLRHEGQTLTELDETLELYDLRERLHQQTRLLTETLQLDVEQAALVVAHLRVSAHPAGPHRLAGPCSLLDVGGVPREYRGNHADGRPIVIVAGCERSLSVAGIAVGHGREGKAVPAVVLGVGPEAGEIRLRSGTVDWIMSSKAAIPRHLQVPAVRADEYHEMLPDLSEARISAGPDLTVLENEKHIGLVAREQFGLCGMRVIRIRIDKVSNPGHLDAHAWYMDADTPESVFTREKLWEGRNRFAMRHSQLDLLDCLVRCGLAESQGESRHLGFYRASPDYHGPGSAGGLFDDEREAEWRAIVSRTDLGKVMRVIDTEAIELLRKAGRHLLNDGDAYGRVRQASMNLLARTCLERLPMIYDIISSSPELRSLPDLASVSIAIANRGASRSDRGANEAVAPIPNRILEWMKDSVHRFHGGGAAFINSCVTALSTLPSNKLPRNDGEWQALQFLVRELGDSVENPARVLGTEAVVNFMRSEPRLPVRRGHSDLFPKAPSRPSPAPI